MTGNAELATHGTDAMALLAGKYLTFALSDEQYALPILKVQEIIGLMNFTHVPGTPQYLKGVINLRGKIIPVVCLRSKFELPRGEYNEKTCIIVVDVHCNGRKMNVGIVVDTVLEVLNLNASQIEPTPDYGSNLQTSFILGMGRTNDNRVLILIDIDKALYDSIPEQVIS